MQTTFGMPPVAHVHLAADLGCDHISVALTPVPWKLDRFPGWSLREDARLRGEMIAAMRDKGVSISQAEGFSVRPTVDVRSLGVDLDLLAELGAQQVSGVCMERDPARALDQLAILADMTGQRGMGFNLEFAPPHAISTLGQALSVLTALGKSNVRLVIDAMHFFRSGGVLAELRAVPAALIGYVQLCDVPLLPADDDYFREACFQRSPPGEGELPLSDFCAALPNDIPIGLEVPNLSKARDEVTLRALARRAIEATRRLLADPPTLLRP